MNKKAIYSVGGIVIVGLAITGIVIGGFLLLGPTSQKTALKIFHAGSLAVPFEEVEKKFESDYPTIDVQLETAGSVQCTTKITEAGKIADVLAVADWNLIPNMDSQYQDYYIKFAVNQMVLTFDNSSGTIPKMDKDNFYEILNDTGSTFGFSNPNLDPCGYRSLMVLQLAEFASGNDQILEDLVLKHSEITNTTDGYNYTITTPEDLSPDSTITIRDKEIDLVTLVKEGGLDYAFEYRSVAVQHNLDFIELGQQIDLSNSSLDNTYARVTIERTGGDSTGKSITYGITVPKGANLPDFGAIFIEYVINSTGKTIFNDNGQPPLDPCITNDVSRVPTNLQPFCVNESSS